MNYRLSLLLAGLVLSLGSAFGYDIPWPQPKQPPGTNAAAFPTPKIDWLAHYLTNLDNTRGKQFELIFDGDSITDFWPRSGKAVWAQHYGAISTANLAIAGDQVQHVLWRVENGQLDGLKPKLVVLLIGTNNLSGAFTPEEVAEGIKVLLGEYEKRCPTAHFLLLGIFPRGNLPTDPLRAKIAATNKILSGYDDGKTVTYLDIGPKFLQADGTLTKEVMQDYLHPTARGYEIWADAIQPIIDQYFSRK